MKKNINKISRIIVILVMAMTIGSCEKYLNKAPEASISDKDAFGNFKSFQGFVEELYNCYPDYSVMGWWITFLWADEVLFTRPLSYDQGNYWDQSTLLYGASAVMGVPATDYRNKKVWPNCWYGIRKANLALSKLEFLTDATQEQKDLIKGQALFFRGWFYFELMKYWGGLPYIDRVLSATEEFYIPRLNYKETALKAAKDFEAAAALLPVNWDDTQAGKTTLGDNRQRISKVMALSYLGKDLLYAASPMMNESSTGNAIYDAELCKQSAKAFADAIKVCDGTGMYKLQSWQTWTDNFWVWATGNKQNSGGSEVIMCAPVYDFGIRRNTAYLRTVPIQFGSSGVEVPTENYVKNYGMANGLPIDDPLSGYNPKDPWTNREPRFYKDIIIDGDQMVASTAGGLDRYAQLYTGGRHRSSTGSITGYYYKRWTPIGCNPWDNLWGNMQSSLTYMRLADVYLMYAETVLQGYGTPQSSVPGMLTAENAVNMIRNRAQLPNLMSSYTTAKDKFMEVIIRERAVELGYDGSRFMDLRRWNLSGQAKYLNKTAIDFDRGANGKPVNITERVVVTRVVEKKHNWFPFQVSFTKLYKEFPQNPGW